MTFRQFAFNNVKRNARQYMSYFFSCMFSVAVFFIYAVIMYHHEIDGHEFRANVQRGIMAVEMIIFAFSFLFVLYSTGAFIRSRKKEYGLLMTLGISKRQLNWLLILENTIIGVISIAAGVLVGILFSNIFIMVFSQILGIEGTLGFYIAPKAVLLTVVSYFIMFELNSLLVVWILRTNSIIDLFRGAKAPKQVPRFSWVLSIIGAGLVLSAYYLAATADLITIFNRMFIILLLIIPGTYLLYTQFSIALISIIKNRKKLYFHKTNLLTISELHYKLKDNARLLFFVTILSAVSFTASGVLYGAYESAQNEANAYIPHDLSLLTDGEGNITGMDQEISNIITSLEKENVDFSVIDTTGIKADIVDSEEEESVDLWAYSDYAEFARLNHSSIHPLQNDNQAFVLLPYLLTNIERAIPETLTIRTGDHEETLQPVPIEAVMNTNVRTRYTIIVADTIYQQFTNAADKHELYRYSAFSISNWPQHTELVKEITDEIDDNIILSTDSKADFYLALKTTLSYTLFFGLFISVLFFLAAGSILYFKMYQGLDKDIEQYKSLYRIGLTLKEMKQIATKQIAFLFFIPFGLAVLHASFAFRALQNMLASSIILPSITLISGYLVIYSIYFFFIRSLYIAKLKKVM
ncbi:ABC transporter permease [Gracilibacillus oryzae]|uniref:ABC transporter permease n=1 Tax=Gracilibacillus oryzae TaxID=1672701 RepID=A0A7C8KQZ2_9BACI|nr:FtsX-like permease family protein [Gracilibacillus oryzae]KAB8125617.1 ABC transporter permease [Gracilibacillus oryzae]